MVKLNSSGLRDKLEKLVCLEKMPVLGICVGMQIFAEYGYENEKTKGLNLIKGQIKKIKTNKSIKYLSKRLNL